MEDNEFKSKLRQRILPILLYCQANKGDLWLYKQWRDHEDAGKKYFYAYYAGLFCRILYKLEMDPAFLFNDRKIDYLLKKYNWYDIKTEDLEKCAEGGSRDCEVPEALEFIEGVDNVAWKNSGFGNGNDAVCLKMEGGSWTFADVRGGICSAIK